MEKWFKDWRDWILRVENRIAWTYIEFFAKFFVSFVGFFWRGVWQASGIDRSIPGTTRNACVSRCPREDLSPNSLAVPPHPPKIASSTAPFELQRLDCQILWREWINRMQWYLPSQLRQNAHRCRWSKECAQTCEGCLLRPRPLKQLQRGLFFIIAGRFCNGAEKLTRVSQISLKENQRRQGHRNHPHLQSLQHQGVARPPIISQYAGDSSHGPSDTSPLTTTVSWGPKTGGGPNPRRQIAPEPSKYQPLRGELPCYLPEKRQCARRDTSRTPSASILAWKKSRIVDARHNHLAIFWWWTGKTADGRRITLGHPRWGQEVSATPDV